MVMVRRLAGGYQGEIAEMQYVHAIAAARNGMVEILDEDGLPTTRVMAAADPLAQVDPAPPIEIISDDPREPVAPQPSMAAKQPLPRQMPRRTG